MDDRNTAAIVVGVLLMASSAMRVQRAAEKSMDASVMQEFSKLRHAWVRRFGRLGATMEGVAGFGLLLYASRAKRTAAGRDAD